MLPKRLKAYEEKAKFLLDSGAVGEVEFSEGTYQIQILKKDESGGEWVFLQLDPQGRLLDSFCTCSQEMDGHSCIHLAAAYLRIFNKRKLPLHHRFAKSLWNVLCQIFADRLGDRPSVLKELEKDKFGFESPSGKVIVEIEGVTERGKKWLADLVEDWEPATEDTSIKFSHLSPEDLALWHEGRPSSHLRYELSFWSDIAKRMFMEQDENKPCKISFETGESGLPDWLDAAFEDFRAGFYLSEANLPLVIPALTTVDSPLNVYGIEKEEAVELHFDRREGTMEVRLREPAKSAVEIPPKDKGIAVGDWLYVPGDGFYALTKQGIFTESKLGSRQISELLNRHFSTIQSHLVNEKISRETVHPSYELFFDSSFNLHIRAYIFEQGDLTDPKSHIFDDWIYLPEKGFMHFEGLRFQDAETVVPSEKINNFVSKNRYWLNEQKGFETHQVNIEAQLVYELDDEGYLHFSSQVVRDEGLENEVDFGQWIYIPGEGFYQKSTAQIGFPVRAGVVIKPEQVPLFIKANSDELTLVPGFFSPRCPIKKSGLSVVINAQDKVFIQLVHERRPEYEDASLKFFDDYVFTPGEGFHKLPIDPRIPEQFHTPLEMTSERESLFLAYEVDQLRPFIVDIDPRLEKNIDPELVIENIDEENDHLAVKIVYRTRVGEASARELLEAILRKERFVRTEAGLFDLKQDRFGWLYQVGKKALGKDGGGLKLKTLDLLRLLAFETVEVPEGRGRKARSVREHLGNLLEFKTPVKPDPEGFTADLRPYQQVGLEWLWFLYNQKLSGLLCDDMGLGKTLQAMALIASVMKSKRKRSHFLVLCPTSVIYHWQDKFHQFLPGCKVFTFYGAKRSLEGFHEDYDVLLTSYGIWRREKELLSQIRFEVAVLDEIQMAKNYRSKLHGSLLSLKSRMSVGLTGTPIENYLRELKSIFDIVLPTYMPGATDFREFFILPIEKNQDDKRKRLLSRFIHPFILRRKKEDVLSDLPEKIEEISFCPLLPQQQQLYKETLEQSKAAILREMGHEGDAIPYLHVFALLARLKQICDHPAVYYQNAENYEQYQSGKWERFVELIDEVKGSGQKAVVFSQYLSQLDIIESHLRKKGIGFAGIRGATIKRGEEVRRFQEDPDCEIFVASLQAAGLGIDLTSASVVVHYDRWWNAARENQATDRVHRIGQVRGVQVFKLVTRGTFEEKIHSMIERKGRLMEDVIGADDQAIIKSLNRDEIMELLKDVEIGKEDQMDVIRDE
jgi:superfamily II DNA or RNA helicase